MSDNMPDFDSMSPEEIMAWMETLAKRQGASEGFTTEADMDIAEIDPDTAVIDEPGYVPFGQEAPTQIAFPAAPAPAPEPPRPVSAPPPPVSQPPRPAEPVRPAAPLPRQPEPLRPAASLPREPEPVIPAAPPNREPDDFDTLMPSSVEEGSLAWLESLAADQGDSLFNLDLSSLGEVEPVESAPAPVNPVTWLEDIARAQGELPPEPPVPAAPREADSLEWLETLARRQGARPEELMTSANLNVAPPPADVEEPAYTPFSFDTPPTHRTAPEPIRLEDPAAFLTNLASEQGYSEFGVRETQPPPPPVPEEPEEADMSLEGIQQAINEGTVTPEQMQVFLEHETDVAAQQPEEALLEDYDADAPPIPAELPDWLLEQVGPPPAPPEPLPAANQTPLDDVIAQPVPVDEMPDWLRADITSSADVDLESIFAQTEDEDQPVTITPEPAAEAEPKPEVALNIDPNDPWVEAFDLEYVQGQPDVDAVPEWYEQNIHDPQRLAAIEQQDQEESAQEEPITEITLPAAVQAAANGLSDEGLPEEAELPLGMLQALPSWYSMPDRGTIDTAEITEAVAEAVEINLEVEEEEQPEPLVAEIPDWLREVGSLVQAEEIPDWLKETLTTEEEAAPLTFELVEPEPVAEVITLAPAPAMPQPTPVPNPAAVGTGSLEVARAKQEHGDLDASLAEYEVLVRGNAELDAVVEDLTRLVKSYRSNPVVYRVLGDGLMRQGKLQAALDTYREALNQL